MNAKLPIIASDFEYFKNIFKELGCGINVDPRNSRKIAKTIDYLVDNPNIRYDMGENGYKAVINKYNWNIEEKKLINFYKHL